MKATSRTTQRTAATANGTSAAGQALSATRAGTSHAPAAATDQPVAGPLPAVGFLRQAQVLTFVPFSAATLWRRCKAGDFPKPLKLSTRVTVWRADEVRAWIAKQGAM